MKKIIPLIIIAALIVGAVFYWKTPNTPQTNTNEKTYRNSTVGVNFTYPSNLSASTTGNIATVHHEVPFVHQDYCDFRGEGDTTKTSLTDFHLSFKVVAKNLVETMKSESPYIPQENFVNNSVVPSPGFIDPYTVGNLSGYQIFEGAEGCGHTIYYLRVSDDKTLVVTNDLITVFSGAIAEAEVNRARAVPGIITKENAQSIFDSIMKTVTVQ